MANELLPLPCPFCGGEATAEYLLLAYEVGCDRCDACMDIGYETEAEAIVAWNRRTPPTVPLPEEVREAIRRLAEYGIPLGCTNADWIRWRNIVTTYLDAQIKEMTKE